MKRHSGGTATRVSACLLTAFLATTAHAAALTHDDFRSATTDGIVKLCTAPESDPLHQAAIGYCVGYLTGAFHVHRAIEGAEPRLVCFKGVEPSRKQEIENYVAWARSHPEHGSALAVDTMFRFLAEAYPCE